MDFWEWLDGSIARDPAGWVAVGVGVLALVSAPIWWWRPLMRRVQEWRARRAEELANRAGVSRTGRQPIRSEVYVFFQGTPSPPGHYTTYGSGNLLGGTLDYMIGNHGPLDVQDVRVDLVGQEIVAKTSLYWKSLPVGASSHFTVHIPFNKDRDVILRWRQGRRWFERRLILPTE